jgi:hypothetical protein
LSVSPIGRHGAFRAIELGTGRGRGTPGTAAMVGSIAEGKTVVTVLGTLETSDDQVTQDAIVIEATSGDASILKEIRFGHQKEALVFDQTPGGI